MKSTPVLGARCWVLGARVLGARARRAAACAALGVALASPAVAQTPKAVGPAGNDATRPAVGPERPFRLAPRVERTLPNGLRVIVTRQTAVPKVSVTLTILNGLASDPPDLPGLAALTADLVQDGTTTQSSIEIRRRVFGMGGSLSASVSQDYSSISTRGLAEFTGGLVDLLADVVMHPTFPQEEIDVVKQQYLQGLSQEKSSPQSLSNVEFRRALFGAHPYARVTQTAQAIQSVDRAKLQAFAADHYRPNNAFLLVVGDVQPDAVFSAAEKAFAGWPRGDVPKPAFPAPPALSGRRVYFVQRPNSVQSSISVGNLAVRRSDPKWFEMTLANTIFGGAFNSRIVRNIREEKGYTYSPGSQFVAFGDAGFYKFTADVRNAVTGPTLTEVFKEIDKFRAGGSEGAELEDAKQYLRGLFPIQTATQAGLSATLNNVYVYDLPKDYPETFRAKVASLTPAEVKAGADALLQSDNSVVVIVGDYPKVKDQLGAFSNITFLDVDGKKIETPAGP